MNRKEKDKVSAYNMAATLITHQLHIVDHQVPDEVYDEVRDAYIAQESPERGPRLIAAVDRWNSLSKFPVPTTEAEIREAFWGKQ